MRLPVILVTDTEHREGKRPMTRYYILGENEIDFKSTYIQTKRLHNHQGRGKIQTVHGPGNEDTPTHSLQPCSDDFLESLWTCAAKLMDYFHDFYVHDSSMMQGLWCRLLDTILAVVKKLPHEHEQQLLPFCEHAEDFTDDWETTLFIINRLLTCCREPTDNLVHWNGVIGRFTGDMGGFRSGLKPWEQFLAKRNPGFRVAEEDHVFAHDIREYDNVKGKCKLPMGAFAIIDKHTQRMRQAAARLAEKQGENVEEALARFDARKLNIAESGEFYSSDGRKTMVRQMHPLPDSKLAPQRSPGWADPSLLKTKPTLADLDERVAEYTDGDPFSHPLGNDKFHMWDVSKAPRHKLQAGDEMELHPEDGKLFDDWKLPLRHPFTDIP